MEAIVYYLLISIGLTLAAAINYRRSELKIRDSQRLQEEVKQSLVKTQQEYQAAVQARLEAEQARSEALLAKNEAIKELQGVLRYWKAERLN